MLIAAIICLFTANGKEAFKVSEAPEGFIALSLDSTGSVERLLDRE
jgi:hypothetical protein